MVTLAEELRPVTWHQAHKGQPVWFRGYGKLREGVVESFGRKNLTIMDIKNHATAVRPFGEVYFRKVSGPPTLVPYRR